MFTDAYTQRMLTDVDAHRYEATDAHSQIHSAHSDTHTFTVTQMHAWTYGHTGAR